MLVKWAICIYVLRYIEIEKYIQMPSSGDQIVNHHLNSLCHDI